MGSRDFQDELGCATPLIALAAPLLFIYVVATAYSWVVIELTADSPVGLSVIKATGLGTLAWAVTAMVNAAFRLAENNKRQGQPDKPD
jgi:hypothetical protein